MKLCDFNHPFFAPVWRRVAIVAACFAWAGFENSQGEPVWAMLFFVIGAYCLYGFFLDKNTRYAPDTDQRSDSVTGDPSHGDRENREP